MVVGPQAQLHDLGLLKTEALRGPGSVDRPEDSKWIIRVPLAFSIGAVLRKSYFAEAPFFGWICNDGKQKCLHPLCRKRRRSLMMFGRWPPR